MVSVIVLVLYLFMCLVLHVCLSHVPVSYMKNEIIPVLFSAVSPGPTIVPTTWEVVNIPCLVNR